MDEFSDEDLQVSIESEDDTRITWTLVSISGQKITPDLFMYEMERYVHAVERAQRERQRIEAQDQ